MLEGVAAATVGYLLHVQFSKGMGNIWWRNGRLSLGGATGVMGYALREPRMWSPEFWDLNYPLWIVTGVCVEAVWRELEARLTAAVPPEACVQGCTSR
jgi:hypothetical protein